MKKKFLTGVLAVSMALALCACVYDESMPYPYEMCCMFMNCGGYLEAPSGFAHEMLHTFGAVDLYTASEYGVTQDYVDYVGLTDSCEAVTEWGIHPREH